MTTLMLEELIAEQIEADLFDGDANCRTTRNGEKFVREAAESAAYAIREHVAENATLWTPCAKENITLCASCSSTVKIAQEALLHLDLLPQMSDPKGVPLAPGGQGRWR